MPHPCIGSPARVRRIRRSSVPWSKSDFGAIHLLLRSADRSLPFPPRSCRLSTRERSGRPVDCQGEAPGALGYREPQGTRMRAPRVIVVGHCTGESASIFCCADRDVANSQPFARLAWRAGAAGGASDVSLTEIPPYVAGVHRLENLPAGAQVTYA